VDPALRLGLRDALHAVRPALPLEHRVGAVALDRERDLLEAGAVVRARAELLDLEAAPLGVAREHPVEVARPERRLVAADPLADLDDHVLAVRRVARHERELELVLERGEALLELRDELPQVGVLARGREVVPRGAPVLREPVRTFELLEPAAGLGGFAAVVVDRGVGHALLRLVVRALQFLDELIDRRHGEQVTT
jgi:hypothetical protein